MRKPIKLVVLSVSAGAGHVRAAQALCAQARITQPDWEVMHVDVMDLVPPAFRALYANSYIKIIERAPLLWSYLYSRSDQRTRGSKRDRLRRVIEQLNTRKFDDEIDRLAADAIVCTHFLPAELLSRRIRKGRVTPPVWVQITDFDVHGLWLHPYMEGYCVASEEVAERLAFRGIASDRIEITGIPIMPTFATAPSRAIAAAELELDSTKPTVLMMSGGAGVGGIEVLAKHLAETQTDLQIIALAGRNETLLAQLKKIAREHPRRLWPMAFTSAIERVMAAADFAITKPGGLTSAECLAMKLPIIVVSPIPGQEERNADLLLESGAALKAVDAASLVYKTRSLIANPLQLTAMRARAQEIARPHAAASVLNVIATHFQAARKRA